METEPTALPGVVLIRPSVFDDTRGFLLEVYHAEMYTAAGLSATFVQDTWSHSRQATVRGLHYQLRRPQGKLVWVVHGEVLDVVADIRPGSPTFRRWVAARLGSDSRYQLWIPPGYAHGFCVLSEAADVLYKCTDVYDPADQFTVRWDDPEIGIEWPIRIPVLSARDACAPCLREIPLHLLPRWVAS